MKVEEHKPVVNDGPKVGRNDPCPCGSGKNIKIAVVKISNDNGYKKLLLDIIYINCQFVNDLSTKFF